MNFPRVGLALSGSIRNFSRKEKKSERKEKSVIFYETFLCVLATKRCITISVMQKVQCYIFLIFKIMKLKVG